LQCRDPFSGDCDAKISIASPSGASAGLAVPRPVFRGLRTAGPFRFPPESGKPPLQCRDPFSGDCERTNAAPWGGMHEGLAVPRPVFRGLRPDGLLSAMRCIPSHLAVPRPVFRGLRRDEEHLNKTNAPCETCSAETRFQGIATIVRLVRLIVRLVRLQCRDPFSGDCDFEVNRDDQPGLIMISCSAETRFQGIATVFLGGGTIPPSHFLSPCSAETRFQGIATPSLRLL